MSGSAGEVPQGEAAAATEAPSPWTLAGKALAALAVDPSIGGIWLRARSGPVRDGFVAALAEAMPVRKLSPLADDETLYGGLDVAATLASGKPVTTRGLLAGGGIFLVPMAERVSPDLAARLAAALDRGGLATVALDEGTEEEALPAALQDRLACHLSLADLSHRDCPPLALPDVAAARARLAQAALPDDTCLKLTALAVQIGIASLRAPLHALRVARALVALGETTEAALDIAIRLTLAPRMTVPPMVEDDPPDAETDPSDPPPASGGDEDRAPGQSGDEILLEAARAMLPADLLASMAAADRNAPASGSGSKSGAKRSGNRRGRRLPSRQGRPSSGDRIDLLATLRAAAPWQPLRRGARPRDSRAILIEPGDIHLRRTQDVSDRLIVFAVDASGSTALARLAEAKGAIEILLAEAYARRDHVALIAFRGEGAEVLLPPTRSIVQTKRRLAALPGGGGTPLAAGLRAAHEILDRAWRKGMAPQLVLLTDGVANIALDGSPGREAAAADALEMARALRAQGSAVVLIDTARRAQPLAQDLSTTLAAHYVAMPRADARRMAGAVAEVLE